MLVSLSFQMVELERDLAEVDKARQEWEARCEEESESQGKDFNLQDDKVFAELDH